LFAPEARADPYRIFAEMLAAPVAELPDGQWLVSGNAAASALLRSPYTVKAPLTSPSDEVLAAMDTRAREAVQISQGMFLNQDPPDHSRLRRLVSAAFTPRAVASLISRMEELVDAWLAAALELGSMDVISDLARPLPVAMITEILGVPTEDRDRFTAWGRALADASGGAPEAQQASLAAFVELAEFMEGVIFERRQRPGDDVLSHLLLVEESGDRLSQRELIATSVLLLFAGYETTVNLIGNGTLALLRNPAEMHRLAGDPSLTANAVEELLRYDPPIQLVARLPSRDLPIEETTIPAGATVMVMIGAANRDPAVFERPNHLDIARANAGRHLAFAAGIHFCLGAPLARAEARVVCSRLARLKRLELVDTEMEWRPGVVFRGLERLRVRL
jgi:cytochrome P450